MDNFEGDPLLILTNDGVTLNFVDGQPTMDQGLENMANISLLTEEGFWGNDLVEDPDERVESTFLAATRLPITVTQLKNITSAARDDLKSPAFGNVTSLVKNLTGSRLTVENTIEPPGRDAKKLVLEKNGLNWISQRDNPAHLKV